MKPYLKKFKEDEEHRKRVLEGINLTGTPLELKTCRVLIENGFNASEKRFTEELRDGVTKSRQIDIVARYKDNLELVTFPGQKIILNPIILGECKYSNKDDQALLIFDIEKHDIPNTVLGFPVFTNGEAFNYIYHDNSVPFDDFVKTFDIQLISKSIKEFDMANIKSNVDKEELYNACDTQLLPALNYYFKKYLKIIHSDYIAIAKRFGFDKEAIDKSLRHKPNIVPIEEMKKLYFPIYLFLPIIVTNKDLIKVEVNESGDIVNLNEAGYCIYLFSPSDLQKNSLLLRNRWEQPVIVCNIEYLDECVKKLKNGINKIKEDLEENIQRHPDRIIEDINTFLSTYDTFILYEFFNVKK